MAALSLTEFATRQELADTLAETVAAKLASAVEARRGAVLAVSGGTTPARFLEALSRRRLEWDKVVVTLVDERFAPPASVRSNEKLVRSTLLQNDARTARFAGLYSQRATVEEAARTADAGIALLGTPFDVVVLGMGLDGHTASFFPDAPNLPDLTDPAGRLRVMPVHAPSGGEPRLTLTLPIIADARFVALHIEGEEKRRALETALEAGRPIATVFKHATSPVRVYWAP
jgi:6-phosphogluconolactonase